MSYLCYNIIPYENCYRTVYTSKQHALKEVEIAIIAMIVG